MFDLSSTEVHVWPMRLGTLADDTGRFATYLSSDERERAARFRFAAHRLAFVTVRATLRILLGRYLGQRPDEIVFAYGTSGKPRLARSDSLHFNVSHSAEVAAFAFADCEVGVDVEAERPFEHADGIASRYFSSEEWRELISLEPAVRNAAFFACWTRKEAFVKATGLGLALPLENFRVTLRPGEPARVVHVERDATEARRWTLHDLALEPGYAGAAAYRQRPRRLHVREMLSAAETLAGRFDRGSGRTGANCEPTT